MILYECELATTKKIKKRIIKKIQEEQLEDFKRFPSGGRLPIFYLLREKYLPFSIEDLKIYDTIFNGIILDEMEERKGDVKGNTINV